MNKRLNALVVAFVCVLMLPIVTFAQLPNPTYGWNLGNTMEPPSGEGTWNNPAATQALINAVANAGFNTVRIPCAWDSHASNNVIDSSWLARVKEVVDYCYAKNLYVIINCHWDNGWLDNSGFGSVDTTITTKINSYWTQIANTFANYNSHLLFACTNEPDVDTASEMSVLLAYEQTFVNAVRATGGNNPSRWIIVQGPCTDIDLTDQLMNTLPTDPTSGRLMVEIHYYSPWNYTGMTQDEWWGNQFYFWGQGYHSTTMPDYNPTWGEEDYMEEEFEKMRTKFVNQGIPVIVGEFGAMKRTSAQNPPLTGADLDLHIASRTYFHKTIVDKANSKGLKPVFWDNGDVPGGAVFDRYTNAVADLDNARALTGGAALPPPGTTTTSATTSTTSTTTTAATTTTTAATTTTTASTTTTTSATTTTTSGGSCDCGTCNWYGTNIPTCCQACSGWGWYDGGCQRSCVCEGSCPGGSTTTTAATTTTTAATTTTTAATTTTTAATTSTTAATTSTTTTAASTSTTTTAATTTTTAATTTTTAATTTTTAATTTTTAGAGCTCDSGCDGTAITPNFSQNGSGQYCWQATSGNYINSWNLTKLEVNDADYTNTFAFTSSFPAKINGVWYIYYNSSVSWGHFELNN